MPLFYVFLDLSATWWRYFSRQNLFVDSVGFIIDGLVAWICLFFLLSFALKLWQKRKEQIIGTLMDFLCHSTVTAGDVADLLPVVF